MADGTLTASQALRWTRIGALGALAMFLGYLETFVPIPIPGVKLGLANIPILVALCDRDLEGAFWIAIVKVLATGLLFGNPVTLAYSVCGTALALAVMCPLSLLRTMRVEMTSVVGALAHEAGQLMVAQLLLGTPLVWYSAPLLAAAGCATGLLCGVVATKTAQLLAAGTPAPQDLHSIDRNPHGADTGHASESPQKALACLALFLGFVMVVMHAQAGTTLGVCTLLVLATAFVTSIEPRALARMLISVLPILLVTLVAQVVNAQQGTVLATLGPVALTSEALAASGRMLMRLACISIASLALVAGSGRHGLAHAARMLLSPLGRLGINVQGPELALSTALQLLPLLADSIVEELHPKDLFSRRFWTTCLPGLVSESYRQALDQMRDEVPEAHPDPL